MKTLTILLAGLCLATLNQAMAQAGRSTAIEEKAIDAFIAKQAGRLRGEEYREARKVASGDLTHDGVAETVVLYTIEGQNGSNNYVQYLAVFATAKGGPVAVTHAEGGGKSNRSIEELSVAGNAIQLATLNYGPKDASCCPSIKGTARYVLVGNRLREQKRTTRR
jgi:hypothetical protein